VVIRFLGLKPAGEDARTFERPTRYLSFFLYIYTNSMPNVTKCCVFNNIAINNSNLLKFCY